MSLNAPTGIVAISTLNSKEVFSVPELASTISSFCARGDCTRLLRTSKILFNAARPFVWKHVDCARHLLLLIRTSFERSSSTNPLGPTLVYIPSASPDVFVRLDVYAPYVQLLDVNDAEGVPYKIVGWDTLLARAVEQPLLPNIRVLRVQDNSISGIEPSLWATAFASPSLASFAILSRYNTPRSSSHITASLVMKSLAESAPGLERLEIFPHRGLNRADKDENPLLFHVEYKPFYVYMARFTSLTALHCNTEWLTVDSLNMLSQLPRLEHLEVHDGGANIPDITEMSTSILYSLRSVVLHDLDPVDWMMFLKTAPLVNTLTSLKIEADLGPKIDDGDVPETWLVEEFIPLLANAPHLTTLELDPNTSGDHEVFKLDAGSLRVFHRLPLRELVLHWICFPEETMHLELAGALPFTTHLSMPDQQAGLGVLSQISTLPMLQHFQAELDLVPAPWVRSDFNVSQLSVLKAEITSRVCDNFEDMDIVVCALLEMFPSLESVHRCEGEADEIWMKSVDFLNGILVHRRRILALEQRLQAA